MRISPGIGKRHAASLQTGQIQERIQQGQQRIAAVIDLREVGLIVGAEPYWPFLGRAWQILKSHVKAYGVHATCWPEKRFLHGSQPQPPLWPVAVPRYVPRPCFQNFVMLPDGLLRALTLRNILHRTNHPIESALRIAKDLGAFVDNAPSPSDSTTR